MTTPPDELAVMTEMLAVLADTSSLGGTDTDPGMDALTNGARKLSALGRSSHFLLVLALSGWLGALEGAAIASGVPMSEMIRRYASALAEAEEGE